MRNLLPAVEAYVAGCFVRRTSPRVDELAQRLEIHPSVLSRTFRAETGRRLSTVMKEYQIAEAQRLLITTHLTVRNIALRAGFGTVNTLYRLFRAYVGITPERYRHSATAAAVTRTPAIDSRH